MTCRVMGIVNVTPDSFSDGGKYFSPEEALRRVRNLIAEGADIIDLGGESTRPGAAPLGWEEEWARLEPVLEGLSPAERSSVPVSVDTYHPETAERALALGARIVNCVSAAAVPAMAELVRARPGTELVLPCRPGEEPQRLCGLSAADFAELEPRLYLDPMLGFGTTREEDLALLKAIPELARRGRVLVGASRKRIVKKLVGTKVPGKDLAGNLAIAVWAALNGAEVVRVHDVRETVQAVKVVAALS